MSNDANLPDLAKLITDLQVRVAFLDDTVRQQNDVMFELSRTVDSLRAQMEQFEEKLAGDGEGNAQFGPAGELPPHY